MNNTELDYKKTNEYKLDKLKNDFQNIQFIIDEINQSKTIILEKINQPKHLYQELIKDNNTNVFVFCLDSLHFQYKLSLMDYESIKNNLSFIMNRMYCDYYKLYNIIMLEMSEKKWIEIKRESFPKYNDLDILYEYDLEVIIKIHNEILDLIHKLYSKYIELTNGVKKYKTNQKSVVSISNFLNTLKYENGMLENQIMLYINYVSFFHFSQKKSLVRLYSKMVEFNKHIDEYSNIDNVISIDDINSVSPMEQSPREDSIDNDSIINSNGNANINNDNDNDNDKIHTYYPCTLENEDQYTNEICKNITNNIVNDSILYNITSYHCNTPVSDLTENNSITGNEESNLFKYSLNNKNNVFILKSPLEIPIQNSILETSLENKIEEPILETLRENKTEEQPMETSLENKTEEPPMETSLENKTEEQPMETSLENKTEEPPMETSLENKTEEQPMETSLENKTEDNLGRVEEIDLVSLNNSDYDLEKYISNNVGYIIDEFYQTPFLVESKNDENITI
jgi:hypothetical protein